MHDRAEGASDADRSVSVAIDLDAIVDAALAEAPEA